MSIEKLSSRIRIAETLNSAENILTAINAGAWETDPYFPIIIDEFAKVTASFRQSVDFTKAESDLEEFDLKRDNDVRAIFNVANGFQFFRDPKVQEAFKVVMKTLSEYGMSITEGNYAQESTTIKSMLNNLAEPAVATAIEALVPLGQLIENLRVSQAEFDSAVQAYNASKVDNLVSPTEIKKEVVKVLNKKLIGYLNIVTPLNEALFSDISGKIAELIERGNSYAV